MNEDIATVANNVFKALDLEHTSPKKALYILGTLCGLIVGGFAKDDAQEKVLADVQNLIRESADTTGELLHLMQAFGSKDTTGPSNGGSDKIH
jgi:hypothetical protein